MRLVWSARPSIPHLTSLRLLISRGMSMNDATDLTDCRVKLYNIPTGLLTGLLDPACIPEVIYCQ